MTQREKISKVIFASVDKSPHCIQLHYLQDEITKLGFEIEFINYVAVDNKLIKINKETISLSKSLFIFVFGDGEEMCQIFKISFLLKKQI